MTTSASNDLTGFPSKRWFQAGLPVASQIGERPFPWQAAQVEQKQRLPNAIHKDRLIWFVRRPIHSKTAVASISIRKSGTAKADTPIQVLAGGFSSEKNSLSALPTASAFSA